MDFKLVWDHYENQLEFVEKATITVCEYSHKLSYVCCGGVEGKLKLYDLSARLKIAESHRH